MILIVVRPAANVQSTIDSVRHAALAREEAGARIRFVSGEPNREERNATGLLEVIMPDAFQGCGWWLSNRLKSIARNSFRFEGKDVSGGVGHTKRLEQRTHLLSPGKPFDIGANLVLYGA